MTKLLCCIIKISFIRGRGWVPNRFKSQSQAKFPSMSNFSSVWPCVRQTMNSENVLLFSILHGIIAHATGSQFFCSSRHWLVFCCYVVFGSAFQGFRSWCMLMMHSALNGWQPLNSCKIGTLLYIIKFRANSLKYFSHTNPNGSRNLHRYIFFYFIDSTNLATNRVEQKVIVHSNEANCYKR